jgi:hypothetical protein
MPGRLHGHGKPAPIRRFDEHRGAEWARYGSHETRRGHDLCGATCV